MNIPKRAIELSIEGGWRPSYLDEKVLTRNAKSAANIIVTDDALLSKIALDSTFWVAFNSATGPHWSGKNYKGKPYVGSRGVVLSPKQIAMRFYDLVFTGQDTEAYWNELLKV